jgi:hypothetical protein
MRYVQERRDQGENRGMVHDADAELVGYWRVVHNDHDQEAQT